MNDTEKFEILEAMQKYGGGFVKALAEAWGKADIQNSAKIERAFPEYIEQYRGMVERCAPK